MKKWVLRYNAGLAGTDSEEIVEAPDHFTKYDVVSDNYYLALEHYYSYSHLWNDDYGDYAEDEREEMVEQDMQDRIECWAKEYKEES